jgi:transforming growth factor-beta-induced protein
MEDTMKKTLIVVAAAVIVAGAVFSFAFAMGNRTIADVAARDKNFSTLVAALKAAGLVETLQGKGPYTVFAPTDEAFAKLPPGTLDALLADIPTLKNILLYHVVEGNVRSSEVVKMNSATAVQGDSIAFAVEGGNVMVNNATVRKADVMASNGVIHVIDTVLLPPEKPKDIVSLAVRDGRFTTLVKAIQAAGLVETLQGKGPYTVFAPTDEAFAKLPAGTVEGLLKNVEALRSILLYHVVPGEYMASSVAGMKSAKSAQGETIRISASGSGVKVNDARVIIADVKASNGVIHVIDRVILPPS